MISDDPDRISSIEDGPEIEVVVKGSRFLGQAFRADDAAQAQVRLQSVRKTHHAATHHCWAYRLGLPDPPEERSDDDGEPSGTAGLPILNGIRRAGLAGCLVVVTRYYGGTKLGTGGLSRAYGESASRAILAAPPRVIWHAVQVEIRVEFPSIGQVETLLARQGNALLEVERRFSPEPVFRLRVKRSRVNALTAEIQERCRGAASIQIL